MKLFFKDANRNERLIAEPETVEQCKQIVADFLRENGYESKYIRIVGLPERLMIDFGSWVEFLFVEGVTFDEYRDKN